MQITESLFPSPSSLFDDHGRPLPYPAPRMYEVGGEECAAHYGPFLVSPGLQRLRLEWRGELTGPVDVELELVGFGSVAARWEGEGVVKHTLDLELGHHHIQEESHTRLMLWMSSPSGEAVRVAAHQVERVLSFPDEG